MQLIISRTVDVANKLCRFSTLLVKKTFDGAKIIAASGYTLASGSFLKLSKRNRILVGSAIGFIVIGLFISSISSNQSTVVKKIDLNALGHTDSATEPFDAESPEISEGVVVDELDAKVANEKHQYIVATGDTLTSILTQYGFDLGDITLLTQQNAALRNLSIGQQLSWSADENGQLQQLVWNTSRRETRTYDRSQSQFVETISIKEGVWKDSVIQAEIHGSFAESAKEAGLSNSEIAMVVKALQWQLDFRKLREGDKFIVYSSREELDGTSDRSQVLGVHMRSQSRDYYAVRAEDGRFYDLRGTSLESGFLRLPTTKKYRVSSKFNPRRVHPVTGKVTSHNGIDYAAPVGTPVLATGDGEVIVSQYSASGGNMITIRHGRQYMTRYMHMSKLLVKKGQTVKRGDRIGLSGNTGRSTGPHIHYEIWVNNRAVNPATAKLPHSSSLKGEALIAFKEQSDNVVPKLILR